MSLNLPTVPEIFAQNPRLLNIWSGLSARDQGAVNTFKDRQNDRGELDLFSSSVSPEAVQCLCAIYSLGNHYDWVDAVGDMAKRIPDEKVTEFVQNILQLNYSISVNDSGDQGEAIYRATEIAKNLSYCLHINDKLTTDAAIGFYEFAKENKENVNDTDWRLHSMLSNEALHKLPADMAADLLDPDEVSHRVIKNAHLPMDVLNAIVDKVDRSVLTPIVSGVNGVEYVAQAPQEVIEDALRHRVNVYRSLSIATDYQSKEAQELWAKVNRSIKEKVHKALLSITDDLNAARAKDPDPDGNRGKTQDLVNAMESMPFEQGDHDESDVLQKGFEALSHTDDYESAEVLMHSYASRFLGIGAAAPDWMVDCVERLHRNGYITRPKVFEGLQVGSAQASRLVHSLKGILSKRIASNWITEGTDVIKQLTDDDMANIAQSDPKLRVPLEDGHPRLFLNMMSEFATAKGERRNHIMDSVQGKMNWITNSAPEEHIAKKWTDTIGQGLIHLVANENDEDFDRDEPEHRARRFDMGHILNYLNSDYRGKQFLQSMVHHSGDALASLMDRVSANEEDIHPEKMGLFATAAQKHPGIKRALQGMWSKAIAKIADGSAGPLRAFERGLRNRSITTSDEYIAEAVKSMPPELIGKVLHNALDLTEKVEGDKSQLWTVTRNALKHCSKEDFENVVLSHPEGAKQAVAVCPRRFSPELAEKYIRNLHAGIMVPEDGERRFDMIQSFENAVAKLPLPLEFVHHLYDTRDIQGSIGRTAWLSNAKDYIADKGIFLDDNGGARFSLRRPDSFPDDEHNDYAAASGPQSEALHTFLSKWDKYKADGEMYPKNGENVHGSVEFAFDTAPLRRLRDMIEERSPITRSMHEKEVQKVFGGDWKRFKDNKGMISADAIQRAIDSTPKSMRYNLVHHGFAWGRQGMPTPDSYTRDGKPDWNRTIGVQRHNEEESKVIRFNVTTPMIHRIKKEGLWEAWKHLSDYSYNAHNSVHPTQQRRTLGWMRWTGHPNTGVFWEECQSDLHSDMLHLLEDDDEYIDKDTAKRLSNILFGSKHPSQAFYEAFQQHLRDHGYTDTMIAVHGTDSKSRMSNAGYTADTDPNAMMYEYDVHGGEKRYRKDVNGEHIPVLDENGVHKPDLAVRQGLSGIPAPVHMKETYDKIPKKNLAMEPSVYDSRNMPTQSNPHFQGNRQIWQGKNRKSEAYSQTIGNLNAGIALSDEDMLVLEDMLLCGTQVFEKALKFRTAREFIEDVLKPFGWEEPTPGAHWKTNHKHGGMWRGFSQSDIRDGLSTVKQSYFLQQLGLRHFAVGGEETFGYQPGTDLENAYKAWGAPTIDEARAKLQGEIQARKEAAAMRTRFGKDSNPMVVPGVPFESYMPITKISHGISDEEVAHPNFQNRVKSVKPDVIPVMPMDDQLVTTNDELLAHARQNGHTHVPVKVEG